MSGDPTWYKDAIIYELHVRAFNDTNGDGIGDFQGLAERMDYLEDLGVTAIWLLPFYPSPLRDDGYDIADYTAVHEDYGTIGQFKTFLREAHRRGIRVITELVLNHTSDQHPWFKAARRAPAGSTKREFYVWSDSPEKYRDARIIFKDFETSNWSWDPVAKAYYWHRFYSHQPDLNVENPAVQRALLRVVDFWLKLGVDGLRLDAVPYLYEREGTSCENLPETHAFLKKVRRHIDARYKDRMLLAEANQWPEDAIAYFGDGDESHMNFHFPLMPRMFMSLSMEDRFPIVDIFQQTPPIPDNCQWAIFLRNHDELTLEMVTDEERDYMYRSYAHERHMRINLGIRRRLAPLLGNNRRKIELMNGLLFSMPGTPVLYYGDEIGMGDNVFLGDRNGVRTPLQWSPDRNAGFSRTNPQRVYLPVIIDPEYHYEAINIETQRNNPQSLYWWMKRLISVRKRFRAFGSGTLEFLHPDNPQVLVYIRRYEEERLLVVANLSRMAQFVEMDLSEFQGSVPMEVFGQTPFPKVGDKPYPITLGPHAFYWFQLQPERQEATDAPVRAGEIPRITVSRTWDRVFSGRERAPVERVLPEYLMRVRWFGAKSRRIREIRVADVLPFGAETDNISLTLVRVLFPGGAEETYAVPLGFASGEAAQELLDKRHEHVLAHLAVNVKGEKIEGVLYDAAGDPRFAQAAVAALRRRRSFRGAAGRITPSVAARPRSWMPGEGDEPALLGAEQSNTSIAVGNRLIIKLYRCVKDGVNPELEISRFLSAHGKGDLTAPLVGALEYDRGNAEPRTVCIVQRWVPNEGDAWQYTLRNLRSYFESAMASSNGLHDLVFVPAAHVALLDEDVPPEAESLIGVFLESIRLLGQRTAELHLALASPSDEPGMAPEPFTPFYQRSLYQTMRNLVAQVYRTLRRGVKQLPDYALADAEFILQRENELMRRLQAIKLRKITAQRIRCHGDYHLGQVLYTGKDFVIIDFEGEPARPISERRIKRPAFRDVAGMLRSFHYAAHTVLGEVTRSAVLSETDVAKADEAARFWYLWVSACFLKAYLKTSAGAGFLPESSEELEVLLEAHLLEKAVYEIRYELDNRPDWISVPLRGLRDLLLVGTEGE